MRIVFMGTPDFGVASLMALIDEGHEIAGVYCQPDRPGNRLKTQFCPVKTAAISAGLPVYQPFSLKTPEAVREFQSLGAQLLAVVAYGKILPDDYIFLPKYGSVNVHGSLLPKYRGSAPIQWAVLNGDSFTGVTTQYLLPEVDSGDIIYFESVEIGEYETSGELYSRLSEIGAGLLVKTVRDIEAGTAPRIPQDKDKATYAKPLTKEMSPIDWSKTAREIIKHICGLNPWPAATATVAGHELRILMAEYCEAVTDAVPGTVTAVDSRGIIVAAGDGGTVRLTRIQAPGGKSMPTSDYLRGHPIKAGI